MSDIISRNATIKAFYIQSDDDGWWVGTAQDAETLLNGLPTAEKVGKWMETDAAPHRIYCSECYATFIPNKEWVAWKEGIIPRHFCPNCGARMDVPNNDVGKTEGEEDE